MRRIKLFLSFTILSFIHFNANAQDGVDTTLFKELGVKKMMVYVKLPILTNKNPNDSCKAEEYEWDTLNQLVYDFENSKCYGWEGKTENRHQYSKNGMLIKTVQNKSGQNIHIRYLYNEKKDLIKISQVDIDNNDSFVTVNIYKYSEGNVTEQITHNIYHSDTNSLVLKYFYDTANNIKEINTYSISGDWIQKQTFDITPKSKKLLEFSTEVKLPKKSFTRGWNYYDIDAQLFKTQYSNNTWTDFYYHENGLMQSSVSYNVNGALNSIKTYFYEFHNEH